MGAAPITHLLKQFLTLLWAVLCKGEVKEESNLEILVRVGEGETGTFSFRREAEDPMGSDSGIPQRLTTNTAEHGIGWSENIFEGGGILGIDPGKLRIGFTCSGKFHDWVIRGGDDHDLIAHERRNAVSDPDRRGSDQGERRPSKSWSSRSMLSISQISTWMFG